MEPQQRGRRREVLELFRVTGRPLSAREVADETELHINTARFHLDILTRQGILRREDGPSEGRGRPATRFALVPGMDRGGLRNYRLLAEMLLSHLAVSPDPDDAALRAGFAWGRYLVHPPVPGERLTDADSLARLTDLLTDIGFDPRVVPSQEVSTQIELRHCPFLELAETQQHLVCTMHLGVMRGGLDQLGARLRAESLSPFAAPDTCIATVAPVSEGSVDG